MTVSGNEVELLLVPSVAVSVIVAVPSTFVSADGRFVPGTIVNLRLVAALVPGPVTSRLLTRPAGAWPLVVAVMVILLAEVKTELTLKSTVRA